MELTEKKLQDTGSDLRSPTLLRNPVHVQYVHQVSPYYLELYLESMALFLDVEVFMQQETKPWNRHSPPEFQQDYITALPEQEKIANKKRKRMTILILYMLDTNKGGFLGG